ncbi:MAG: VWA domain-containing protein [Clostridiales bacterium]|nr:VWA domain-containing protein [Clostridiales bacterium]
MKKGLTELVMILDRSGSMSGLEADTIGGFNSMIDKQKKEDGDAYVSVVLFDDRSDVIYDRVDISRVEPMTDRQYYVRGCTALLDAVGGAIRHIRNVHKYAREEDVPEKTVFVITTDGMENASRRYSYDDVRRMIEERREKDNWEFIFLGANIDAAAEARRFGISASRAARYDHDGYGTALNYSVVSEAVSKIRMADTFAMGAIFEEEDVLAPIRENYRKKSGSRKK